MPTNNYVCTHLQRNFKSMFVQRRYMGATKPANKLRKVLGVAFGIAVGVGGTIGVGILRTPASIAAFLPSPTLIVICWIACGLFILLCASSYAELTTMFPKAGGAYNYIQSAFGR